MYRGSTQTRRTTSASSRKTIREQYAGIENPSRQNNEIRTHSERCCYRSSYRNDSAPLRDDGKTSNGQSSCVGRLAAIRGSNDDEGGPPHSVTRSKHHPSGRLAPAAESSGQSRGAASRSFR